MTVKELKGKWNLRQARGSAEYLWMNTALGLMVYPCPVGFVVRSMSAGRMPRGFDGQPVMRGVGPAKIVPTVDKADKALQTIIDKMQVKPPKLTAKRLPGGSARVSAK